MVHLPPSSVTLPSPNDSTIISLLPPLSVKTALLLLLVVIVGGGGVGAGKIGSKGGYAGGGRDPAARHAPVWLRFRLPGTEASATRTRSSSAPSSTFFAVAVLLLLDPEAAAWKNGWERRARALGRALGSFERHAETKSEKCGDHLCGCCKVGAVAPGM